MGMTRLADKTYQLFLLLFNIYIISIIDYIICNLYSTFVPLMVRFPLRIFICVFVIRIFVII